MMFWIIGAIVWWLIGLRGFIFWWTKDDDLSALDLTIGIFSSVIGPLTWIFGAFVHSGGLDMIIIKKKE